MPSYRFRNNMEEQMRDLLLHYKEVQPLRKTTANDVLEIALDALWQRAIGSQQPEPPHIVGWKAIVLSQASVCADTGVALPIGMLAYQEEWSDGRAGDILSRESLIADGILDG